MYSWMKWGAKLPGLVLVLMGIASGGVLAGDDYIRGDCCGTGCCQMFHCPPHLKHCWEGPPRFCFREGCPKPVIVPCNEPNWGYYETCWIPWPWGPDWSHCPVQPPASLVFPHGAPEPGTGPGTLPGRPLPPHLLSPEPANLLPPLPAPRPPVEPFPN